MKAAFVFSGQGAQQVGMGKDLVEKFPVAADIFKKADPKSLAYIKSCYSKSKLKKTGQKHKNEQFFFYVLL